MSLLSIALNLSGVLLFIHSAYSSYEHSLLTSASSIVTTTPTAITLPPDIIIEVLVSTALVLVGIVLASPSLRPIVWADWAGETEKDLRRPMGKKRFAGDGGAEGINMSWLDDRKGFIDIRTERRKFADWIRRGSESKKIQ